MKKNLFFYLFLLITLFTNKLAAYGDENIGFLDYSQVLVSKTIQKESVYEDLDKALKYKDSPFNKFERDYKKLMKEKGRNIVWQDMKEFSIKAEVDLDLLYNQVLNGARKTSKNKPHYAKLDDSVESIVKTCFELKEKILQIINYYRKNNKEISIEKLENDFFILFDKYKKERNIFIEEFANLPKKRTPEAYKTNYYIINFKIIMDEFFIRLMGYLNVDVSRNTTEDNLEDLNQIYSYLKKFNSELLEIQNNLEEQSDEDLKAGEIPKNKFSDYIYKNRIFISESRKLEETMKSYINLKDDKKIKAALKDTIKKLEKVFDKYYKADEARKAFF